METSHSAANTSSPTYGQRPQPARGPHLHGWGWGRGGEKVAQLNCAQTCYWGGQGGRSRSFWLRLRCLIDSHSLLGRAHPSPSPRLPTRKGAGGREAQLREGSRRGGAPGGRGPLQRRDWGLDFGCKGQGCCGVSGGRVQWSTGRVSRRRESSGASRASSPPCTEQRPRGDQRGRPVRGSGAQDPARLEFHGLGGWRCVSFF